jgi:type VI secretion system protein ImpB
MAKHESSVAPKEMVTIKLPEPAPGAEGEELPFRMAVVGDFTGKRDDTAIADRKMFDINQKNFNDIMAKMDVSASFSVANKLSGAPDEEIPVDLDFKSMKDFHPETVANKVPQVKKLVEFRKMLVDLKGQATRDPAAHKKFNKVLAMLGGEGGEEEKK